MAARSSSAAALLASSAVPVLVVRLGDDAEHAAHPVDRLVPAELVDGGQQVPLAGDMGEEDQPGLARPGPTCSMARIETSWSPKILATAASTPGRSATSMLR